MTDKSYHLIKLQELRKGNLAILDHLDERPPITFERIERVVCKKMRVKPEIVYTRTRKTEVVLTRQFIHHFTRKLLGMSWHQIERTTGYDHATALLASKKIEDFYDLYKDFREKYHNIQSAIEG